MHFNFSENTEELLIPLSLLQGAKGWEKMAFVPMFLRGIKTEEVIFLLLIFLGYLHRKKKKKKKVIFKFYKLYASNKNSKPGSLKMSL